jgi:hypothetical protein
LSAFLLPALFLLSVFGLSDAELSDLAAPSALPALSAADAVSPPASFSFLSFYSWSLPPLARA